MKEIIIFGTGKIAEVIYYYAHHECGFKIAAFTTDAAYLPVDGYFLEKRVVAFEEIVNHYPPDQYDMFVAIGYHDLNDLRKRKCIEAIEKGYLLISIVSEKSSIPENVRYGFNCFIMPPAIIHPCVKISNNVFIWSGAMIGHHSIIEDHCWITSSANIGGNVKIGAETFVAMNATVSHSIAIGKGCFLGANTLVTNSMDDGQVVITESSKPIRLNSKQFLKFSNFS